MGGARLNKIKISGGLSHADYAHLADLVRESTEVGIDYIHADAADMEVLRDLQLMGGHQIVRAIRPHTHLPVEVHAYLNRIDETFIDSIAEAGADMLILNIEPYMGAPLAYIIDRCRRLDMKFGVTLTCFTPWYSPRRRYMKSIACTLLSMELITRSLSGGVPNCP